MAVRRRPQPPPTPCPLRCFHRLVITLTDLYPSEEWNFVFGMASITSTKPAALRSAFNLLTSVKSTAASNSTPPLDHKKSPPSSIISK